MKIEGKRVLLTGATGGIGGAIARRMHAEGAVLVLTGRRAAVLEPLATELYAELVTTDLTDDGALTTLIERAGAVDILIANAALPGSGRLAGYSAAEIDRAIDVNLRAPIRLAHGLLPAMVARGSGHIVFVSSMSGKAASPYATIYSATKFGLRGFALALRAELRETGVGVSAVYPGFVSDAGLFAETQIALPSYVKTRTPEQVAEGIVRAITRNKAEVDVAPAGMRGGAILSGFAPEMAARLGRVLGGDELAEKFEAAQLDKRG